MSKQILVFGDSVAYGAWDEEGGWAERLKREIHKKAISSDLKFYCDVYNLSIDGDDAENVLKRFEFEAKQRIIEEETIVIFAVGINDSCFIKGESKADEDFDIFRRNIAELAQLSSKLATRTVFLGLSPIDEERTNPVPWSSAGVCCKSEYVKKYNDIIKSVCLENNADFVEIYEELCKLECGRFLFDGVHPNSAGHDRIYQIVSGYLEATKIT